jgi:hypothetical protein
MLIMRFPDKNITVLTIVLLVVLLCLPVYGPDYFAEYLSSVEANHAGFVCDHAGADSDHESQDGHQQIGHCHELDAPCVTAAAAALDYSPAISILTSSDKGALLDGYGAPFDIPPENRV